MNKKIFLRIIGVISLFAALLLGIFAKEPFINFVASNNNLVLSGSFSFFVFGSGDYFYRLFCFCKK